MSSTNKTPNLELSQYVDADQPTYLGDYNADMLKIDTANGEQTASIAGVKSVADAAQATANAANVSATEAKRDAANAESAAMAADEKATAAGTAASTADAKAVSAQSTATAAQQAAGNAQTTANNALPKASLALNEITLPTPVVTIGGAALPAGHTTTNSMACLADPTFSFFKLYNAFLIDLTSGGSNHSGRVAVKYNGVIPVSARPAQTYTIAGCGDIFVTYANSTLGTNFIRSVFPGQIIVGSDGSLTLDFGVSASENLRQYRANYKACLYINADLGDSTPPDGE